MPVKQVISADEVYDRILDLIAAVPEAAEGLPEGHASTAFWKATFDRNDRTRRLLEMFRELPAFTSQAPRRGDAKGWRRVMEYSFDGDAYFRPPHAANILKKIVVTAKPRPKVPGGPYWRDCFAADQLTQRVRPAESNAYLHNPHRGTTTFQRFQGDEPYAAWFTSDQHGPINFRPDAPVRDNPKYIPRTTLSYCRWPWATLEPEKGKYRWDIVDLALKTAHNRGQTLQFRFQPFTLPVDYDLYPAKSKRHPPKISVNVPDWYWDTGAKWIKDGPYLTNEPDSNDPKYIEHFGDFIRAFAARYDGHPDLESVDVAYAGVWGESGGNATPRTSAKLVDIYLASFKKTMLLSMLGTHGCKHAAKMSRTSRKPVGFRADCIGDLRKVYGKGVPPELCFNHTFDQYPREIEQDGVKEAWQTAPVTMETCGNVTTFFMENYDLDVIAREGYRYHTSVFMPKSSFYPQAVIEKMTEFDKKIGYRFAVRQMVVPLEFKPGQPINVQLFIDNVGCAPIYRPYALAVRFRQGAKSKIVRLKADIRGWMPGHSWFEEKIATPRGLEKGEVKLDLVIVNDENQPKVWFAIDARTGDGWHPMTSMDVL